MLVSALSVRYLIDTSSKIIVTAVVFSQFGRMHLQLALLALLRAQMQLLLALN